MSDKLGKQRVLGTQSALAKMLLAAKSEQEAAVARIARLLHDDVSQVLSAVGLQLDAMRMDFRDQLPGIETRAAEIQTMLEQVIEQLRDISNELNPSVVERAGLTFALDRLAGKTRKSFSGNVRLHVDSTVHVPGALATTFYNIAECAVDNALARGCSLVEIHVKRSQGEFVLEVRDNGPFDEPDADNLSLGHLLMDYYASRGHVVLETAASPTNGTVIRASFPAPAEVPETAR
jgi:signal transduction histidine kinase